MASLPWIDFLRLHPGAHLVIGIVMPVPGSSHLMRLRRLLNDVIAGQSPQGIFSTALVRQTGKTEIHCGFAAQADADRFARTVKAKRVGRPDTGRAGEWASEHSFRLTPASELALSGALAARGETVQR